MGGTVARAHIVYWAYVALWGIGIAPMVNRYLGINPSIVMTAFLSAAATFGAMSLWGYTSKRDLSGMGAIAGMALMGLLIAAVVNMVVAMFTGVGSGTMMISMLISFGFVIFVSLITAWETQIIKEMYVEADGSEAVARKSIFGAFMLYGSFISIFVNILQILGFMNSSE
jgi:FtsH-binding integral membrane protein